MKKILAIICLVIAGGLFWALMNYNTRTSDKKITIQFASWGSESELRILKPLLKDFEDEYPNISVEFLHIPQNYFQKIHLLFASNTAPDVIFINNQYLPVYANAGVLADLSDYDEYFNYRNFYSKSTKALSWKNKIYAVPRDVSNLVIFYNKDIFDKYNIKYPNASWTFEDFLKTAKKLTHLPDVFGVSFDEEPLFFLPYLTSSGGWTDYDTKHFFQEDVLNSENNKLGLNFYSDLRKKYHVAPKKEESASATMAQLFLQGHLGMQLSGRWLVPKYREEAKFNWDIVEFPHGKNGSVVPMDASGWAIAASSKHKNEAILLIKYLSSKKCSEHFTKSGLIVPARIDVSHSNVFLDGQKPQNAKAFLNVIKTSEPTPVTVNYREILDSLKAKTEYLFN